MENRLEFLIPFVILLIFFLPKLLNDVPIDNMNELIVILTSCVLIGIVISVLRKIKKLEN